MGFSSRSVTRPASGRSAGTTCTEIRGMSSDTRMTEAIAATARWQNCAIVDIATRTPVIKSFFLRLSETFNYTAGQHVDVRLIAPNGYTAMRSYCVAHLSADVHKRARILLVGSPEKRNFLIPLGGSH